MTSVDADEIARRTAIIVGECEGISPIFEAFYIHSIIYSAERASTAFPRYEDAVRESNTPNIASSIQEALGHAASLSRFFWPSIKTSLAVARAEKLRRAFNLSDSSPLKQRELRDALEHFDERLDQFLLVNDAGYFFPTPIIDDHSLADEAIGKFFKLVDPRNGYFVILGRKYEFFPIFSEVRRILNLAQPSMSEGGRLSK